MSGKTCRMAPLTVYDGPDIDPFCTNWNIAIGSCTSGEWAFVVYFQELVWWWWWCVCVCEYSRRMSYGGGDFFSEEPLFLGSRTIWKGIREDKGQGYNNMYRKGCTHSYRGHLS